MANIQIQIKNLDKLRNAFKAFPDMVKNELNAGIDASITTLEATAKTKAPADTGHLRDSHRRKMNKRNISGIVKPNAQYARWVHEGTRPHWPPTREGSGLRMWARKKNINVYAVATAISRRGTKGQPWLDDTARVERSSVEREMQKAVDRAIRKAFGT